MSFVTTALAATTTVASFLLAIPPKLDGYLIRTATAARRGMPEDVTSRPAFMSAFVSRSAGGGSALQARETVLETVDAVSGSRLN